MAQLNDTMVQGDLRVTGSIFNKLSDFDTGETGATGRIPLYIDDNNKLVSSMDTTRYLQLSYDYISGDTTLVNSGRMIPALDTASPSDGDILVYKSGDSPGHGSMEAKSITAAGMEPLLTVERGFRWNSDVGGTNRNLRSIGFRNPETSASNPADNNFANFGMIFNQADGCLFYQTSYVIATSEKTFLSNVWFEGTALRAKYDGDGMTISTTYMKSSSGTYNLSYGATTAIGSVNGTSVNVKMPAKPTTVDNATNATNDSAGNNISSTYLKLSGGTMTGKLTTQGSVWEDSASSGALDMQNSNIINVNSIYTADNADNASEGIHFCNDGKTKCDTIWANGGTLYFVPQRSIGTGTSAANSERIVRSTTITKLVVGTPTSDANTVFLF